MLKGNNLKLDSGFTLIELLISAAIFSIIALFATGSLVSVFNSNRKSNSLQAVMTNLNFTLEEMSREIRFGEVYHCGTTGSATQPRDCATGDTYITFKFDIDEDLDNEQVSFRMNDNGDGTYEIQRQIASEGWEPVSSGDVRIKDARFYVTGSGTGDGKQPRVTVVIHAEAGEGDTLSEFTLQNTLVQRKAEI